MPENVKKLLAAAKGEVISRLGSWDEAERWAAMYRNTAGVDRPLLNLFDAVRGMTVGS